MEKYKPIKIAIFLTDIFFCLLVAITIALPNLVTWYVETMGRSQSLPTTIMVTCYPCAPITAGALFCLRRFLKNVLKEELFSSSTVRYLTGLSICCIVISAVTLIAGRFYLPFFVVAGTFAFLALLAFAFREVFSLPKDDIEEAE